MDSYTGEIQLFAFNYAPYNWSICAGQILAIQQNTALFSLLGVNYGGNGTSTYGLPNLMSRVAIGQGQGPGLTPRDLGETGGVENVTMIYSEMPVHTHTVTGSSNMANVSDQNGTQPGPSSAAHTLGAFVDTLNLTATNDAYNNQAPDIPLNVGPALSGTIGATGGNFPFSIMQPTLGLNYCICQYGIYPARS